MDTTWRYLALLALLLLLAWPAPAQAANTTEDLLVWTNQARLDAGSAPLTYDATLARVAQERADQIAGDGYFTHCLAPAPACAGGMPAAVALLMAGGQLPAASYAENIAGLGDVGPPDLARLTTIAWLHSSEHRAHLLAGGHTRVGFGVARRLGPLVMPSGTVASDWLIVVQELRS